MFVDMVALSAGWACDMPVSGSGIRAGVVRVCIAEDGNSSCLTPR